MTIKLSSKGGGGEFVSSFASGRQLVSSGATGNIIVLTPPAGKRVRVNGMQAQAIESGITITVGARTVVSSLNLDINETTLADSFLIGQPVATPYAGGDKGSIPYLLGLPDEVVTVTKDAGSTSANIYYGYEFGE